MSKRIAMVSVILCLGLFLGTLTSAVGTSSGGQNLDNLMEMLVKQGSAIEQYDIDARTSEQSSVKQLAQSQMTADQTDFALALASQKRENMIAQQKYLLQRDYYSLYQLVKSKESAEMKVDISTMSLGSEVDKLSKGLTTEASVLSSKIAKRQDELSLEDAIFNLEKAEAALKDKLGLSAGSELPVDYSIPSTVAIVTDYSQDDLVNKFLANNMDIETLNNNIKLQKAYIEKLKTVFNETDSEMTAAVNGLTKMENQLKTMENDYTMYAKGIFHTFNKSAVLLQLQMENKTILDNKAVVLDKEYLQKKYTTLEYNQKKMALQQEYRTYDAAIIDYLSNKTLVDLVMQGIKQ